MTDLMAFLAARLDEDEAAARTWLEHDRRPVYEVEAKRAILARHAECAYLPETGCDYCLKDWPCADLLSLAAVYRDHPDCDPAWAPEP